MNITVVVAAIVQRNGKILITRRFDHVHLPGLWEFPGGKVEAAESLEAALEREILEELGVKMRVSDEYSCVEHQYASKLVRIHFFSCTIVEGEPQPIDVAELRWVVPSELMQYPFPAADAGLISNLAKTASDKN